MSECEEVGESNPWIITLTVAVDELHKGSTYGSPNGILRLADDWEGVRGHPDCVNCERSKQLRPLELLLSVLLVDTQPAIFAKHKTKR